MQTYSITHLTRPLRVDAHWEKTPWNLTTALEISQFAGPRPIHLPGVQARLAYDAEALYVIFQVLDRYVLARAQNHQEQVFKDSCVEFFFTPGEDLANGYFNLEVNCGGTALFHHQLGRRIADQAISPADLAQLEIAHTLPQIVWPEIQEEVLWVVEYRLPFALLANYTPCQAPRSGSTWRANLYKCADASSHPHWLSWTPVATPEPDFHRPEFFGRLIFA
ncbi:MAG: carbohydrate-binding family 9-like protein [Anaerolineales bacterium]|nr:carbohydrate-binding family 9-like protein [Anaerolineales bacterium]